MKNLPANGLYPIIRRVRRPLLPVDSAPVAAAAVPTQAKQQETEVVPPSVAPQFGSEVQSDGAGN